MDATTTQALAALQEIPPPPAISYLPATPAWGVVAALVLAAVAYGAWRRWRRWQANAYRRAALRELERIEARLGGRDTRADAVAELPALVKRTALARFPRERVAGVSEDAWLAFLDRTCPPGGFAAGPGKLLPRLAYAGDAPSDGELRDLTALVRRWIARHRADL